MSHAYDRDGTLATPIVTTPEDLHTRLWGTVSLKVQTSEVM